MVLYIVPYSNMDIRKEIKRSLDEKNVSIRKLSEISGVRRQSIMRFLRGGNIHLDNLNKLLDTLNLEITITQTKGRQKSLLEERLSTDPSRIAQFCKKNKINFLAVFGSILDNSFTKDSDIDVLVKFEKPISFFDLAEIEKGLKKLFKTEHDLDVVTLNSLSPLIREGILNNNEVLYEKAS